jgi:membrane associated rhomboid family serine protease
LIPLRDTIPRRTVPFVTRLLFFANVGAFVLELLQGDRLDAFLNTFAFVPARLFHPGLFPGWTTGASVVTMFTAMFLHAGFLHLAGNMLFLWVFGDNVEDALGHGRFLLFYLVCGLSATLLQAALSPDSTLPNLGASGAIAGVLGAYFVLYPRARIVTIVPLFVLFPLVEVPAGLYLLVWFLMQFWMGSSQLVSSARGGASPGGVAFWAHVGGFVAGLVWVLLVRPSRRPPARYRIS